MAFRIAGYTFSRPSDCGRGRAREESAAYIPVGVFPCSRIVRSSVLLLHLLASSKIPQLSGQVASGTIQVGGLTRTYLTYIPQGLPKGSPLVVVMHGSGENGARMRIASGYGFERLADEHRFCCCLS